MSKESNTLVTSIENGWKAIKGNRKMLNSVCPNMNGEQKEAIYKSTESLIENIIEDFEQLKVEMQPKDKPVNSFGKGEKTEADKARDK